MKIGTLSPASQGIRHLGTCLITLSCLLLTPICFAATENTQQPLDEVQISANREKLLVMRLEMYKMEDQFYQAYNALSDDRQYHVFCTRAARLGTKLKARKCEPAFIERTDAEIAYEAFNGVAMPPADVMNEDKWAGYKKHALQVINSSPKLLKMVREREAMGKRYEAARKKAFEGKLIAFE